MKPALLVLLAILCSPTLVLGQDVFATDHFTSYKVKPTKGAPKFVKLGPVRLQDQFRAADYVVVKPVALLPPADKNGEGRIDESTHLVEYKITPTKGTLKFQQIGEIRIVNQCNDLRVTAKTPTSLLVPSSKNHSAPVPPPAEGLHELDHFLCYQATTQKKLPDGTKLDGFPKKTQVTALDQFQERLYDLKRITKLCNPVAKSGNPFYLSGPNKGSPAPLTPASIRNVDDHLVCYKAVPARKRIPQDGCGPTDPSDKGTKIEPKPGKHVAQIGLHVSNQLGALQVDTVKEIELCIPSRKILGGAPSPPPSPTPTPSATPGGSPTVSPTPEPTPTVVPCGDRAPACGGPCVNDHFYCRRMVDSQTQEVSCGCVGTNDPDTLCDELAPSACGLPQTYAKCPWPSHCKSDANGCFCEKILPCGDVDAPACFGLCPSGASCVRVVDVQTSTEYCDCAFETTHGVPCSILDGPTCSAFPADCPPNSLCVVVAPDLQECVCVAF